MDNLTCSLHATYLHTIYVKSREIHILITTTLTKNILFSSKNNFFLSKLWYGLPYQPKKVVRSEPYQPYRVLRQWLYIEYTKFKIPINQDTKFNKKKSLSISKSLYPFKRVSTSIRRNLFTKDDGNFTADLHKL